MKRILTVAAVVAASLAAAAPALAINQDQARGLTKTYVANHCSGWGGYGGYCSLNINGVECYYSGVNRSGTVQWTCNEDVDIRNVNNPFACEHDRVAVGYGPFGGNPLSVYRWKISNC